MELESSKDFSFPILKNASNKSCSKLNFLQKTQRRCISISPSNGAGVSISPSSGAGKLQRFSIPILKNASNKSCSKLNFLQRTQRRRISISPSSGAGELQRFSIPISVNYIFKMANVGRPPISTPGGDRDMHLLSFLYKI